MHNKASLAFVHTRCDEAIRVNAKLYDNCTNYQARPTSYRQEYPAI
jgi:hypothetical protein